MGGLVLIDWRNTATLQQAETFRSFERMEAGERPTFPGFSRNNSPLLSIFGFPNDYIVKAGQLAGPKIIRYRKRRNHAAIFGCWLPSRRLRPVSNGRSGGPRYPRAQQRDDCCRRQEIRLRPWGREVATKADRWQGVRHRRAVPGDQGTHWRFLDIGMR